MQCQQNLYHIGETVSLLVLTNNGLCPLGPADPSNGCPRVDGLSNAYPKLVPADPPDPNPQNDSGLPWWARVYEQWDDIGLLFTRDASGHYDTTGTQDAYLNPNGHTLTAQLPLAMSAFHCPMAGALDGSSVVNLFNSISYGINFDVRDSNGAYTSASLSADDLPDQYRTPEIRNPSQFILISEACVGEKDGHGAPLPDSGGRISPWSVRNSPWPAWNSSAQYNLWDTVSSNGIGYYCTHPNKGSQPPNALYWSPGPLTALPIVGRHSGYANVLFADGHVEAMEATADMTSPQWPTASRNVNTNLPLWTLSGQ